MCLVCADYACMMGLISDCFASGHCHCPHPSYTLTIVEVYSPQTIVQVVVCHHRHSIRPAHSTLPYSSNVLQISNACITLLCKRPAPLGSSQNEPLEPKPLKLTPGATVRTAAHAIRRPSGPTPVRGAHDGTRGQGRRARYGTGDRSVCCWCESWRSRRASRHSGDMARHTEFSRKARFGK